MEVLAGRRRYALRVALPVGRPAPRVLPPPTRHSSAETCREATAGCASGISPCCPVPTLRLYFRHRTVSRHIPGSGTRYAVSAFSGGTRKRSLKRGRKSLSTRLASSMVVAPASLISVTNLSWSVPAVRSTRPLACGDRANISCTPISPIARENWVGAAAVSDGGVCLKTPWRSE